MKISYTNLAWGLMGTACLIGGATLGTSILGMAGARMLGEPIKDISAEILKSLGGELTAANLQQGVSHALQKDVGFNHDIQKAMCQALGNALDELNKEKAILGNNIEVRGIFAELHHEQYQQFCQKTHLARMFDDKGLGEFLLQTKRDMHVSFEMQFKAYLTGYDETIVSYIRDRLVKLHAKHFGELLKQPEHEAAWKAFQRLFLERLLQNQQVMLIKQDTLHQVVLHIGDELKTDLESMHDKLDDIHDDVKRNKVMLKAINDKLAFFGEDGQFVKRQDKQKPIPPLEQIDPCIIERLLHDPSGVVKLRDTFYIERQADSFLKHEIQQAGTITIIRAPRQTGKSSLLVRGIYYGQ